MNFCFSTLGCPDYDLDQIIHIAQQCGYEGVEFRIYRGTEKLNTLEEFQRPHISDTHKRLLAAGLKTACVSSSARFSLPGKENQKAQIQLAEDFFQIAHDLECPYVRVFGGPYPKNFTGAKAEAGIEKYRASLPADTLKDLTREECDKWIMDSFGQIGEIGRKYGVMPLMETHDDFCDGSVVHRLVEGCGSSNFGILWDALHPFRYGMKLEDTYQEVQDRIHHVHLKDSSHLTPWGFTPALVGDGEMDIQGTVDILKKYHYDEFVCFEWEKLWFPDVEEPQVAFPQFIEAVSQML